MLRSSPPMAGAKWQAARGGGWVSVVQTVSAAGGVRRRLLRGEITNYATARRIALHNAPTTHYIHTHQPLPLPLPRPRPADSLGSGLEGELGVAAGHGKSSIR